MGNQAVHPIFQPILDEIAGIPTPKPITRKVATFSDATMRELAEAKADGFKQELAAVIRQVRLWRASGALTIDPNSNKAFLHAVEELKW